MGRTNSIENASRSKFEGMIFFWFKIPISEKSVTTSEDETLTQASMIGSTSSLSDKRQHMCHSAK